MTRGKNYRASIEKYDEAQMYDLGKGIEILKETAFAKFD